MAEVGSSVSAERYEFDAPSHVVDFKQLENTDNDDTWFDHLASGQDGHTVTPLRPNEPLEAADKPKDLTSVVNTDLDDVPSTSWAAGDSAQGDAKPVMKTTAQTQPRRISKRKGGGRTPPPPVKRHKSSCDSDSRSSEAQKQERARKPQREAALRPRKNPARYKAALTGKLQAAKSSNLGHNENSSFADGSSVPKPVNPSTTDKRKVGKAAAYVPVAQRIMQLENQTPERFRLRSRQNILKGPSRGKGVCLTLTQPRSPRLLTSRRNRPSNVKSSAEVEAKEMEELHETKFKAQGLNKKILESTECLKKPVVKASTVHEAFTMHIEKRLQERRVTKPQDEEKHTFKAQQVPKKILEGVVGVPERKVLHPTVPESPAFLLKKKARIDYKAEEVKPPSPIKAPPVPHFGLPFQPLLPENHQTEICPFSFEQRELAKKRLREEKLEKRNEEVPEFKAQLMPDFDTVVLPERKKLEPTKPEPFRLMADERGAIKNNRLEQTVKDDMKKLKEAATFRARPNTVSLKPPFQPKKEDRSVVVTDSFELATERRARERQEFEQLANEKEALRAHMEERRRREEQQQEKDEIAKMRQEQVHKAQPVKYYKSVEVKKSDAPLTVPKSPNFSDRFYL